MALAHDKQLLGLWVSVTGDLGGCTAGEALSVSNPVQCGIGRTPLPLLAYRATPARSQGVPAAVPLRLRRCAPRLWS